MIFNVRNKIVCMIIIVISILLLNIYGEPRPLPRANSEKTTPTLSEKSDSDETSMADFNEKPQILMDLMAVKVEIKKEYTFGVEWDKPLLEKYLGKPLKGEVEPSLRNPEKLDVKTLLVKDPEKLMKYLSEFGEPSLIYLQTWSQNLGEQITRQYQSVIPFVTRFGSEEEASQAYTQSTIKIGMTSNVTLSGLQLSGNEPNADIMMEIELKDAYKTPDNLYATNEIISADYTTVPLSQTLIQTNLFVQGDSRIEYIFLLTPRKIK